MKTQNKTILSLLWLSTLLFLSSCNSDPFTFSLNNASIYEKLPAGIGISEFDSSEPGLSFSFVAGEGDTNNADFSIIDGILTSKNPLMSSAESSVSIRVAGDDDGTIVEKVLTLDVLPLSSANYPSVLSETFVHDQQMPSECGAFQGNVSPAFSFQDIPTGAKTMALTMRDLDFGNSFHWVVWNIPADIGSIDEGAGFGAAAIEGFNEYGQEPGYTGPFPPEEHRYLFKFFILDGDVNVQPEEYFKIESAMVGKVMAQMSILGRYTP